MNKINENINDLIQFNEVTICVYVEVFYISLNKNEKKLGLINH